MSLSLACFNQRLAYIRKQSRERQIQLMPRITDRGFWRFAAAY